MTCDELTEQIYDLTAQMTALQNSVASQRNAIDTAYNNALPNDIYGGTYPPVPIQYAGLQTRITFLGSLNPKPQGLIGTYSAILGQLATLGGTQASLDTTIAALGSMKSQYIDQGCQPPLS